MMHCLNLGGTQEVCGNLMLKALEWLGWGSKLRSARCATIWIRLHQHCKEQMSPIEIQSLPLTAIKQNGQITQVQGKRAIKASTLFLIVLIWLLRYIGF